MRRDLADQRDVFSFISLLFLTLIQRGGGEYTAENKQVTLFYYALSVPANKNVQKRTVFVLTEK